MPGMMPPLQLSLGSSAKSGDAQGGSSTGGGMGALNSGDWIIQTNTGSGGISAATGGKVNWLYIGLAAAVWFLKK
jgi:hypothetical protein